MAQTKDTTINTKRIGDTEVDIEVRDSTAYGGGWFGKPPENEPVGTVTPSHDDEDDPTKQTKSKERALRAPTKERNEAAVRGTDAEK